jgi:hypothetical protein
VSAIDDANGLFREHLERYPRLTPQDLYKLAHQACLGPGHLLNDATPRMVRDALAEELRSIDLAPRDWEDTVEVLCPSTGMARIHLRPFVRSGGAIARLADALLATVEEVGEGDADALGAMLAAFRSGLAEAEPGWPTTDFDLFLRARIEAGLGPVSHSDEYRDAYDPHYRVVLLDSLS